LNQRCRKAIEISVRVSRRNGDMGAHPDEQRTRRAAPWRDPGNRFEELPVGGADLGGERREAGVVWGQAGLSRPRACSRVKNSGQAIALKARQLFFRWTRPRSSRRGGRERWITGDICCWKGGEVGHVTIAPPLSAPRGGVLGQSPHAFTTSHFRTPIAQPLFGTSPHNPSSPLWAVNCIQRRSTPRAGPGRRWHGGHHRG
jgi:hypothetical protein